MKNSKLILLLETFSTAEWRRFGEFLVSPFFNKRKELIVFFEYLKAISPDFSAKKLDKTVLFQKVFPNKKQDDRTLVHLNNYLLKQAEHFLAISRLEKEAHSTNMLILEELYERQLGKNYRHYLSKAQASSLQEKEKNNHFYLHQYQLSDIAKRQFLVQNQRRYDATIQLSLDHLDEFYFFNKLKIACEMLEWKNIIAVDYQISFIDELIYFLKKKQGKLNPVLSIYLIAYDLLTKEDSEADFLRLMDAIQLHQDNIPDSEKNYFYVFAINFCGQQIKKNIKVHYYANHSLDLYLAGVEQKILYVNGYLSPWIFKNITKLGFNLKKFDWTAQFIQTYHTHLEKEFQADALHFNMADLYYRKKNYQQAQYHLMQIQYSDIFYNLGAKTMLIKIYFETNEEEALLSMIASFTIYLKRNKKMANNIRQTYLNFTSLIYQILKAKANKIAEIQEKIKTTELLTDRQWLLNASKQLLKIVR